MIEFPKNKYKIIYADPPWSYNNKNTGGGQMVSGSFNKYQTMEIEEICNLPIQEISDKNCVLFLWATVPLLPEAFKVMNAWGFTYKTSLFWRKIMSLGMGYWFRGQVELLLFGIKGNVKAFRCQKANIIQTKVRKHSRKPDEFYGTIEEISQKFNLNPKIELFSRTKREGWDAWGNEVPKEEQRLLK